MKAKAAIFMGANAPFEVREYPVTEPPAGYARLRLDASGVCGTDVHFHRGKLAMEPGKIIGHEFVGTVEALGAGETDLKIGDRVISDIAVPCGKCPLCLAGDDANCVNMRVTNGEFADCPPHFHGGYAEVNYSPLANLIRVPERLDPKVVCAFACPGPTALHAFGLARQAGVRPEKSRLAVVQGLGPVGMFAVAWLKRCGAERVVALTARENPRRAALARGLGADEVLSVGGGEDAAVERISELTGGLGADLAFEASGAPAAVACALRFLRNRGVYLVPGQYSESGAVSVQPQLITFKALRIIGSSQYSVRDVEEYVRFLAENPDLEEKIAPLVTAYAVEDVNAAFRDAEAGRNVKTVLVRKK